MVRELERKRQSAKFPETAPAANPVFFRTYSRRTKAGLRETWDEVCDRTLLGLVELGKLTQEEAVILDRMQRNLKAMPSGRWLWVGGTDWITKPKNFSGAYNCTSTNLEDWSAFGLMMDLAMMGCGTGAVLEPRFINQLPPIRNQLNVTVQGEIGSTPVQQRREYTQTHIEGNNVTIHVGDSREGWVESYQALLELSTNERFGKLETQNFASVEVLVDISDVRKAGETLNGFGGVANPVKLPGLYQRCASILNKARGRQLNSVECCLLIDQAAVTIVAGNIRRSAGMRQGSSEDSLFADAKDNLWQQDESGNWRIDPERDALRMANHSRVFHHKPSLEECLNAVRKQYYSGEGAIQWAGEAVARSNIDLLPTQALKVNFLQAYEQGAAKQWLQNRYPQLNALELEHRLSRYGLNPCHSGDTLVSTDQGLVPIKDLIGKPFRTLVDLRSVGLDGVKLTDAIAFATGVQTTYTVTLENGLQMRCTADHKHFTNHGWVATKDLTSEHSIYIQKGEGSFGEGTITIEQAQMLGWLYGDGSIYKGYRSLDAVFYINQKEYPTVFPLLSQAVESLTGYNHKPSLVKGVYTFHSGSCLMNSFLEKLGIQSKNCLPDSFLNQSKEVIIGFLQGLFSADGCVSLKARHVELRNLSKDFLRQVQLLLLNLEIKSSLKLKQNPGEKGVSYILKDGTEKISQNRGSWRLIVYSGEGVRNFYKLVGFPLVPEKQQRLEQLATKKLARSYSETIINRWFTSKVRSIEEFGEESVYDLHVPLTHSFIANGCITHNCGEIIGSNFHCNLSEVHLNQIDPHNYKEQEEAFTAGALSVAALLNHKFLEPRYQSSRELDPIVGVSFTGLFDFFVHAFGVDWLRWWEQGRPATAQGLAFKREEEKYLISWKDIVHRVVWDYCDRHNFKRPNRCTTVQPSGTKALLTNASSGWHPPKAQRFIRRITFGKNDPVALACIDYGYNVIPSQSDKDEQGNLLNDPFDPRVSEWLVEIPVSVSWADLPGADEIDVSKFSVLAQFDFVLQVQRWYVTHNTSATLELRSDEIEPLGQRIYETIQNDEGYISAALLARFDDLQSFPRLPFEPIDKPTYDRLNQEVKARRKTDDFCAVLSRYDLGEMAEAGPSGCDSDKCMFPDQQPSS
ncbi:ribonucleoside-triphosphate reductase, adenosylcobalamin-dependent [Nostoc sphaeroides]|uniref:NrdJ, ribonucleotide reductase, class II n=1 Tax=Nostoc sphaeroides CCNUC1 TaxID=2653204 RepID=A0A5P8W963_9NOSO|nr:ribonucleoside-triphosphate reductase, adenosylcobalamin-dependent [Nostoc sphaeroides]MCC5627033.1 ribonucleoside-triphosphate reductase, adenosylcobalamin-dependent [Nostoc sphaeroides CHAB 2801]QFS48736.1 nrdJ, ribonucleotide reductase, class II [Nostoc sphaeroides CCNUC1]